MASHKRSLWSSDWFQGLVISIGLLLLSKTAPLQSLELAAYDWGLQTMSRSANSDIAIIAIDNKSIANLGRWPWPRELQAQLIDKLANAGAKTIVATTFLFEPQTDRGLAALQQLRHDLQTTGIEVSALDQIKDNLDTVIQTLDTDQQLEASISTAGNVLLPMLFQLGLPGGNPNAQLPDFVRKQTVPIKISSALTAGREVIPPFAKGVTLPLNRFGQAAAGVGHLNSVADSDGKIRSVPLIIDYFGAHYPSLSLVTAAHSLNLSSEDILIVPGMGIDLGGIHIATDAYLAVHPFFYRSNYNPTAFQVDSFYDAYVGNLSLEKYRNKIVLIGASAEGVGTTQLTPIDANMPPVIALAHSISSILNGDLIASPSWAVFVSLAAYILAALCLILLIPKVTGRASVLITLAAVLLLSFTQAQSMSRFNLWLPLVLPIILLILGYVFFTVKRFFATEQQQVVSELEQDANNRALGLAYQGQGQLDLAFDKFRRCVKNQELAEALYGLGLDFERKRQHAKAANVYSYIHAFQPNFKDIEQRKVSYSHTGVGLTGAITSVDGNAQTIASDSANLALENPTFGRYRIIKEIGRGGMGLVYLGEDPRINRTVAIKTLELTREYEGTSLEEAKLRFFREAEAVGNLNHVHIITIYDVGEEHDLAYIAMEYLTGDNLQKYTHADNLLALEKVIKIGIACASALSYAHTEGVVHRDIKPSNIMYDVSNEKTTVTDFGIARIMTTSVTQTGLIMGSPGYMSPEQMKSSKLDGRTDIYSLGVTLYQLLCGQQPFVTENINAFAYQLMNVDAPALRELNPALPEDLCKVVHKAIEKEPENRFQDAAELLDELSKILIRLKTQS